MVVFIVEVEIPALENGRDGTSGAESDHTPHREESEKFNAAVADFVSQVTADQAVSA